MSDHHQLGAFLSSYPDLELEVSTGPYGVADDIIDELRKLGWRKPRIITTAEELDALPEGSVVLDRQHDVAEKHSGRLLYRETRNMPLEYLAEHYGPFTVLHEGVRDE